MKKQIALVTDSASNVPPGVADSLRIRVVAGSYAFDDARVADEPATYHGLFETMCGRHVAPRTFGPTEAAWTEAFVAGLEDAEAVACLVTPFDVASSFTTASAAMLAIQFDRPEARIKIVNPGIGSAGLAALLLTLGELADDGNTLEQVLEAVEELEPRCESIFVPADASWLGRSGRLALIADRLGGLDDEVPVLRVGTRLTGIAKAPDADSALELAVQRAGDRCGSAPMNVVVAHASTPERANRVAAAMREAYLVKELDVVELAATIGSQLGPGAVGIGVAPIEVSTGE